MTTRTVGMAFLGDHLGVYPRMTPEFPFERDGTRYQPSEYGKDDWLVLVLPNSTDFRTQVPLARRVLVLGEPSCMHTITSAYANQFGVLVSPYNIKGYRGHWYPSHAGLPWLFGLQRDSGTQWSFEELQQLKPTNKRNELSVVVSGKVFLKGHRGRLQFVQELKSQLGPRLHLFGRGINEIDDKADAILPYAYHMAIENTVEPNYWTEKLSDAYLGYAFPLYVGCPNIGEWFDDSAMKTVDITNVDKAVQDVIHFLDTDDYQSHVSAIQEARDRVLNEHTIFNVVSHALESAPDQPDAERSDFVIEPLGKSLASRIYREAYRVYHQIAARRHRHFD